MKTVKPLPTAVLLFGFITAVCTGLFVYGLINEAVVFGESILAVLIVAGAFVFFLFKYLGQEKIYYDENSFTVSGADYTYDQIDKVTVDSEQILRSISTLRLTVYVKKEEVCSFTKSDSGAKEFIALMKKHGVSVSIDI